MTQADDKWVPFNLNEYVRVKLNQRGLDILKADAEELRKTFPKLPAWEPPKTDADGWSKHQLWSLMQDFGPHITLGGNPPMETGIEFKAPLSATRHTAEPVAWIHPNGVTTATDKQYWQMTGTTRALWAGATPLYAVCEVGTTQNAAGREVQSSASDAISGKSAQAGGHASSSEAGSALAAPASRPTPSAFIGRRMTARGSLDHETVKLGRKFLHDMGYTAEEIVPLYEAPPSATLATEKGLTPTGQHIADCERDAALWRDLVLLHPMDLAMIFSGAPTNAALLDTLQSMVERKRSK